jgi:zinc and cadmium transporter
MENTFWTALGASSLAALVTTIGIYVIRYFD